MTRRGSGPASGAPARQTPRSLTALLPRPSSETSSTRLAARVQVYRASDNIASLRLEEYICKASGRGNSIRRPSPHNESSETMPSSCGTKRCARESCSPPPPNRRRTETEDVDEEEVERAVGALRDAPLDITVCALRVLRKIARTHGTRAAPLPHNPLDLCARGVC